MMKNSVTMLLLLLVLTNCNLSCTPKFILSSTVQESISIYSFSSQKGESTGTYTYSYFQAMFKRTPQPIISINTIKASEIRSLNYEVSTKVQDKDINFLVKSKDMTWVLIQVQFILHSRDDLFSQINQLNIPIANTNSEVSYINPQSEPSLAFAAVNFVLGVTSSVVSEFSFSVQPSAIFSDRIILRGRASSPSTIRVQTVYFSTLTSTFEYAFDTFTLSSTTGPQFRALWASFAPVVYSLIGINKLSFRGNNFDIQTGFDLSTDLISITSAASLLIFDLTYLALGQPANNVCFPCNNFISIMGCLQKCPNNSYPEIFAKGGKTCRKCSASLGQTVSNQKICVCPNSQVYQQGNCYSSTAVPKICASNQLLIGGQCLSKGIFSSISCLQANTKPNSALTECICKDNFQKIGSDCVLKCPTNSQRNRQRICVCNAGFMMNNQQQCESKCPQNSQYNSNSQACQCENGFEMIQGKCIACANDKVFDQQTRRCVSTITTFDTSRNKLKIVNCGPNQVSVNGKCQCNDQSIIKGDGRGCLNCPSSTFKASNTQCQACPDYCQVCSTAFSCSQCAQGFFLSNSLCEQVCGDGRKFVLPCDDGNKINGDGCSSTCQVQKNYYCTGGSTTSADKCVGFTDRQKNFLFRPTSYSPVFTSPGIVTDFVIYPPVKRTTEQLYKIFKIQVSNPLAQPQAIFLSQSQDDLGSYRCFFDYHGSLPLVSFVVTFTFNSPEGSGALRIPYDPLNGSIRSALHFMDEVQDILE